MSYKPKSKDEKDPKDKKPYPSDKPKPAKTTGTGSVLQSLTHSGLQVSALNSLTVTTGTSSGTAELVVATGYMNAALILGDATAYAMVSAQMNSIITAFAINRGYTTGVTAAKILTYIQTSCTAFGILLALYRSQNVAALTDGRGNAISNLFQVRPYGNLTGVQILQHIHNGSEPSMVDDADNISNAEWAQHYLSELPKLVLPVQWIPIIMYFFSAFFDIGGAGSSGHKYLGFYPSVLSGATTMEAEYDTLIATLDAMVLADPDITQILDLFGFTSEPIVNLDFTRDLKGQTLLAIKDPRIHSFITNSQLFDIMGGAYNDDDVVNTYWDIFGINNIFSYPDVLDINVDLIGIELVFRQGLQATISPHSLWIMCSGRYWAEVTGESSTGIMINPFAFTGIGGALGDASRITDLVALSDRMRRYSHYLGFLIPYETTITMSADAVGVFTISSTIVTTHVLESANTYDMGDDVATIQNVLVVTLLFGPGYRQTMQSLLAKMRYGNTNISY